MPIDKQVKAVADTIMEMDRPARLEAALRAILAEPYGCPFCDSGKLRNPTKGHTDKCGFGLAQAELSVTTQ